MSPRCEVCEELLDRYRAATEAFLLSAGQLVDYLSTNSFRAVASASEQARLACLEARTECDKHRALHHRQAASAAADLGPADELAV